MLGRWDLENKQKQAITEGSLVLKELLVGKFRSSSLGKVLFCRYCSYSGAMCMALVQLANEQEFIHAVWSPVTFEVVCVDLSLRWAVSVGISAVGRTQGWELG